MLSMLVFMITVGIGIGGIYITIDFCEYLRKFQPKKWERVTFKRPFGISRQDFLITPIKPHRFLVYIFTADERPDGNVSAYKLKLKLVTVAFVLFLAASFFVG